MSAYLFQNDFLDISYDEKHCCLHLNWKGYLSDAAIKTGINRFIDLMTEHQVFKVLNDNTHTLGIWTGVASWLVFNARPRARDAGLQAFAHVYGPSRLSRISADAALLLLSASATDIKAFDDIDMARHWLRDQS